MAVFDGVHYSLSLSLPPTRRNELAAVLDLNGAAPHPPYTHLVALPASHAHNNATNNPTIKLVTDRWVDRSVVMGKCQPEQYYSPDPAMIFSGVVACATDLSVPDLEVLSAGITALGGQWRIGLTRDVTHLFALRTGSDKYNTALHFASQTHMCILTPHWFDDAVRLGRRIPEAPYAWPDPPVLRPGVTLNLDDDPLATEGRRRRKPVGDTEVGNDANVLSDGEHIRVWAGRRILLSTSLELGDGSRSAIEAGIQRAGGVIVPITENADEDVEEQAVDECDVLITRWRSGKSYFKAARASLFIGTLSWLFSVESSGTLHSPLDSLLWYPTPRGGIPDLINCEISITNYTGAARDYLKRLIVLVGAKFTPSMSQSNKVLVAGFQPSPKTDRALSWSIPVVNHTWLEDCFVEWRALTVGLERYIVYPPGIDFGKMLMTRHDGSPSSQVTYTPRLSGGAVPGGRGIGIVDVEQEEARDAEYRARAQSAVGALGLLTMQGALANDTTTDEMSVSRLEGEVPTESRARAPSRAGSVKKTPSSSVRAKRGLISAPMTTSATGVFVDHVVLLPTGDEDEDVGGKQRTPANCQQRARAPLIGSRTPSQSVPKPSPAGPSWTVREVEAVGRDVGGSPRNGRKKEKGKEGCGVEDTGKRRTGLAQEAEEDEDAPWLAHHPIHNRRLVERGADIQTDQTEVEVGVEKQAPAQESKLRRRAKGMTIGSDSDSPSDAGEGEGSMPPRRATDAGSTTPVKSGMKPRPRSKLKSRPRSVLGGESGDEARVATGTSTETGKQWEEVGQPRGNGEVVTKDKEKGKFREGRKETEKVTSRPRSPTGSPLLTSSDTKNPRTPKRRLSVLVPSVPRDYFSSPGVDHAIEADGEGDREYESEKKGVDANGTLRPRHKQLAPAASMRAVAVEASASTSKRGKPSPAKASTTVTVSGKSRPQPKTKAKSIHGVPKEMIKTRTDDNGEEMNEDGDDTGMSIIVDIPMTFTSRGGSRRIAANKATTRLREEIMPDVVGFEKEQKQAKRRRSMGGGSIASPEGVDEEKEERGGKRRKVETQAKEEEKEEAEVEDEVLVSSVETKPKPINGKSKTKGTSAAGSNEDADKRPAKNTPSESHEKKGARGRGGELAAIRLITTGVTLLDDVIKRLVKLGVQMTTKPTDCTHLVAKGIVRTEKFLCAMSVSPYVLTEEWANASAKGGKLLPENDYLLSDTAAEQRWAFEFADSMARAKGPEGGSSLFKQMTFYVTPKVSVDTKLLKNVVSAGGGQLQTSTMPTTRILKGKANRYVISCLEDKAIWRALVQEGFKVYSPELVLRGALRQEIEWEKEECLVTG